MELMPEDILQGNKSEVDSTTDIDSTVMAHCISSMCKNPHLQYVASFPGKVPFWLHKERGEPVCFLTFMTSRVEGGIQCEQTGAQNSKEN